MKDVHKEIPTATYWQCLESGRLGFQRCRDCGTPVFYPRVLCPVCGGRDLKWQMSSGRGTVYATTAVYHRDREPHNVVLIDLEEGFRMMSRVEGLMAEEVEIGMNVVFKVRHAEDGPVVAFVPEEE